MLFPSSDSKSFFAEITLSKRLRGESINSTVAFNFIYSCVVLNLEILDYGCGHMGVVSFCVNVINRAGSTSVCMKICISQWGSPTVHPCSPRDGV